MVFDVIEIMEIVRPCFKRKIILVFPAKALKLCWLLGFLLNIYLLLFHLYNVHVCVCV